MDLLVYGYMNFPRHGIRLELQPGGDTLQQLLRGLLLLATGHYVDDFNGLEFDIVR